MVAEVAVWEVVAQGLVVAPLASVGCRLLHLVSLAGIRCRRQVRARPRHREAATPAAPSHTATREQVKAETPVEVQTTTARHRVEAVVSVARLIPRCQALPPLRLRQVSRRSICA